MSLYSQCTDDKCSRLSHALFNCCEKHVCIDHLKDHIDKPYEEFLLICDQYNRLRDKFNKISIEETSRIKQLDQWFYQAHQYVNQSYKNKRKGMESSLQEEKQKLENEFNEMQQKATQVYNKREVTKENNELLKHMIKSIEEKIYLFLNKNLNLTPLIINQDIHNITSNKYINQNILSLSLSSPYITIRREETSCYSIATNHQYILINQSSNLCLLNKEMIIEKKIRWSHGHIFNMFFSTILDQFIILTKKNLFSLDQKTMDYTKYSILDNHINKNQRKWLCGTCFNQNLFLSTTDKGSSIYQYKLFTNIQFYKQWWRSTNSSSNDDNINDLQSNYSSLAIIISNKTKKQIYLEVRSSITFEKQWIFNIEFDFIQNRITCSSFNHNQWLITNTINSSILHIDQNGKIIKQNKYYPSPRYINQLNKNILIISTEVCFNLHQVL